MWLGSVGSLERTEPRSRRLDVASKLIFDHHIWLLMLRAVADATVDRPPNRGSDLFRESTPLLDLSVVTSARVSLLLCV